MRVCVLSIINVLVFDVLNSIDPMYRPFQVISKYLDYAIELDYTFVVIKYNVQQILGSDQVRKG